jgi:predicted glycosyl hydrolase (DUF1957 family)
MNWINFLHIYQPSNADARVIKEATEMCYERILRALEENRQAKFTLNISACLIMRWEHMGYEHLIHRIKSLIDRGQIELTGTAAYHPIIPLIPVGEIKRQIIEHEETVKKHFGNDIKLRGFFFPEMAYSPAAAKIIKEFGYEWVILDEIAVDGKLSEKKASRVYLDANSGLKIVTRSRIISNTYVPDTLCRMIKRGVDEEYVLVTGTDGEIYGLRHQDPTGEFEKILKQEKIKTVTISEFIKTQNEFSTIAPSAHSWDSSEKELEKKEPFNLWDEKENMVQKKLWQLARLAYNTMEEFKDDDNYYWARWHLVRGLASCTFWWASAKDFSLFGPISWNPDEIERGVNELIRSIRAIESEKSREIKVKAEKLYIEIKKMIWEKHWAYYWKKNAGKKII